MLSVPTFAAGTDASGGDMEDDFGISVMSNDGISLMSLGPDGDGGISYSAASGGFYQRQNTSSSLTSYSLNTAQGGGFDTDGYSPGMLTYLGKSSASSITYTYYFGASSSFYVDVIYPVYIPAGTAFKISIHTMLYMQWTSQNPANDIGSGTLNAFTGGCSLYLENTSFSSVPIVSGLYQSVQNVAARTSDINFIKLRFTAPAISSPSFKGFYLTQTTYSQVADTPCHWRYVLSGSVDTSAPGEYGPILSQILSALQSGSSSPDYSAIISAINTGVQNIRNSLSTVSSNVQTGATNITNAVNNTTTTITNIFQSTQEQIDAAKEVTDQISDKAAEIKDQSEQVAAGTPQIDAPALAQAHNPMDFIDKSDPVYTAGVDLMQSFLSSSLIMTMLMLSLSLSLVGYVLHGKRV